MLDASISPVETEVIPIPCIRLTSERMLVDSSSGPARAFEETLVPVIELSFDYSGVSIRASDARDRLFISEPGGLVPIARNLERERRARYLLESCGAVELGFLDGYEPSFDSTADYVVQAEGNVHGYCSFGSHAIPQLRSLGFRVDIDDDYPYQVVSGEIPWYADIQSKEESSVSDWFNLELGVEIGDARISLLDVLLELLKAAPKAASLDRVLSRAKVVALAIGSDRYLTIPREKLELILEVLRELYNGSTAEPFAFRREQAASIARLAEVFEPRPEGPERKRAVFEFSGETWIPEQGKQLLRASERPQALPSPGLHATLRPYQEEGLGWLKELCRLRMNGVLADDMGLGKTLQTIALLVSEQEAGRLLEPALIVAPTSLVGNWQREIIRFAPSLRVLVLHGSKRHTAFEQLKSSDVVITTYPVLVRDQLKFSAYSFHLVILDEAQAIKNAKSLAHRATKTLSCQHRLCLTGTPIENNLGELWALFDFLMPGFLGSFEQFRAQFQGPIERGDDGTKLGALRARVTPFILRRMKDRVASDLPPKTELVRPVELTGSQRHLYESIRVAAHADVRNAIRQKGLSGSTIAILDALMKLRQVCCDPRLVRVDSARKVTGSAKYEMALNLVEQQLAQGRRILIFSQFTSMLFLLERGLMERKIEPLVLTGSTRDRQAMIDAFEAGKADVFLISLKAGGTGLNLTSADTVIHYDPWWNPTAQAQATDRAYRIGQLKPVFVYQLIVSGSVEERMLQLQQKKRELADAILGQRATEGFQLSEADVDDLFMPLPADD